MVCGVVIMIEGGVVYIDSEWFYCGVCGFVFNNIKFVFKICKMECLVCYFNDISISNININKNEIMMKIVILIRENVVDNYFGYCEYYIILIVG